jgi:glycerol-3-phosphate O-acyltransferase / dihydroxyacetone phosphate acyltransferase
VGTILYDALAGFLTLVTRIFFRSVEVSGLENVPAAGPVIFVGNHPNSLLDPVLVTTTCQRPVRFAAKEVLFKGPLRPLLWVLGSVPIRRRQDQVAGAREDAPVEGAPERVDNSAAFDALLDVLADGEAFGIFPEGISHTRPELAPLKTGAARIALLAAERGIPLQIVPVGLHYRRRDRMRSRVLVQYGVPLMVDDGLLARAAQDAAQAARELTAQIGLALRAQTINATDFETLRVLEGVRRLYRPLGVPLSLAQQAELMRRFIDGWERLQDDPEVSAFYKDVSSYQLALRALGMTDRDLRGDPISILARMEHVARNLLFALVLVPAAIPGIIIHLPVLAMAVWAGEALTSRGDVRATIKMCVATLFTLVSYGVVGALVLWRAGFPDGLAAAASTIAALLLSGYATIRVLERQGELRRGLSTFLAVLHLDREIARLGTERERLRARLLELIDKHLGPEVPRIIDRAAHDDVQAWLDAEDAD